MPYSVSTDTLPAVAKMVAQQCGARFTVNNVEPGDLWGLMRLSLAMGKDDQAAAALDRMIVEAPNDSIRSHVMRTGLLAYLSSHAPRIAPAQKLMQRLDGLAAASRVEKYEGHAQILLYWRIAYNPDSMRTHAKTAITLLQAMTPDERDMVDPFAPYFTLLGLANDEQDVQTQSELVDQALKEVGSWHDGKGTEQFLHAEHLVQSQTAVYGRKTRALKGKYWFNDGGHPHPAPGKVSLIVHFDHLCGVECYPLYTVVRSLHEKYGDSLDITLITDTRGHAITTGIVDAPTEAKAVSDYYLTYLKLPVALLVDVGPVTKHRDGKLEYKPSPIGEMFDGWRLANTVVVDAAGRIQWLGAMGSPRDTRMIEKVIDRAFQRKS